MSINPLLFQEAIAFFKNKIQLPSAGWTDLWQEQHSHAFVVAGAQKDALVSDFYNAIKKAQTEGTGYAAFREAFDEIVSKHGWSYNGAAGWRSKVIYQTNITQAYNAGRYRQMQALKQFRPFWRYVHTSIEHPRLEHLSWDGLILSADDPWWDSHMPQNGWRCKCRVDSLSRAEALEEWKKSGKEGVDTAPEIIWEEKVVGKNGAHPRTVLTPKGIDPGFGYNPGKAWLEPHTVPPLEGFDAVLKERGVPWAKGFVPPQMPIATRVPESIVFSEKIDPVVGVKEFLDVFGASLEKGAVFIDAVGSPLVISKALFVKGSDKEHDNFKWLSSPDKADRLRYLNLLAMTVIEPDEIWWYWEKDAAQEGNWRLRKRYLRAFEIGDSGKSKFVIAGFEWSKNGWTGNTVFPSSKKREFDKRRIGRLVFKKGAK